MLDAASAFQASTTTYFRCWTYPGLSPADGETGVMCRQALVRPDASQPFLRCCALVFSAGVKAFVRVPRKTEQSKEKKIAGCPIGNLRPRKFPRMLRGCRTERRPANSHHPAVGNSRPAHRIWMHDDHKSTLSAVTRRPALGFLAIYSSQHQLPAHIPSPTRRSHSSLSTKDTPLA